MLPFLKSCYDSGYNYVRRALFGAPPPPPIGRSMGRAMIGDTKYDPLKDFLKKRGFSTKDGQALGLKSYTETQLKTKFPKLPRFADAIGIPYTDIDGKPNGHTRFRYLVDDPDGFQELAGVKPQRYAQEKGTKCKVYFPPGIDWQDVANDPSQDIFVTEGELKSASAALKAKLPCLGLGGVNMAIVDGKFLPEFDLFQWEERKVYIAFDSDIVRKIEVQKALNTLAFGLTRRGARVHPVYWPPEDGKGLDDYLQAKGPDAFQALYENAPEFGLSDELYRLNEEVALVLYPGNGMIVRLRDDELIGLQAFTRVIYAPRQITITDGKNPKTIGAAEAWLKWPLRNTVERITFAPGQPRITTNNELNTWKGYPYVPKKGALGPWLKLFNHLTARISNEDRRWLEQWLAYPLQKPGAKMASAVLLWGEKGVGKSMLCEIMCKLHGDRDGCEHSIIVKEDILFGKHNKWQANKTLIVGDELTRGGPSGKRDRADKLKSLITQKRNVIEPKFVDLFTVPDVANYMFMSNHADAIYLEPNDRRYFVVWVGHDKLPQEDYNSIGEWMESEDGPAALFHHLLSVDLAGFNPYAPPPITQDKVDMTDDGRSELEEWLVSPPATLGVFATTNDIFEHYNVRASMKVNKGTMSRHLRTSKLKQWGERPLGLQAKPVKDLGARVWIVSRDPAEIKRLCNMSEAQVYKQYCKDHPKPGESLGEFMQRKQEEN